VRLKARKSARKTRIEPAAHVDTISEAASLRDYKGRIVKFEIFVRFAVVNLGEKFQVIFGRSSLCDFFPATSPCRNVLVRVSLP
jgi:hypothetical protein